jgi:tetratricopeptide (TPR) repeat protein
MPDELATIHVVPALYYPQRDVAVRLRTLILVVATAAAAAGPFAQSSARNHLRRGRELWDQRLAKSAIASLEIAARDNETAAEAHEALGGLYTFKGWQQEGVFPGWHDEPACRPLALAELRAAVAANPNGQSAQEALRLAEAFASADKVDPAAPREGIKALDARIDSYRTTPSPVAEIEAAIDRRVKMQADPAPYFIGAQILIDRGEYDRAIALAERGRAASDRFVGENLSAYQLTGKSQGAYSRGRSAAADLIGWAAYLKKDYVRAGASLGEAERLSRGQDFTNQFHLAELARATGDTARARDYYLTALALAAGPAPLRQRSTDALSGIYGGTPASGPFDSWLETELTRRREERRMTALKSVVDRPLPTLSLTNTNGRPFDAAGLRGKVLLLNFFASW